jgi:gamma-glutamylcysteine synthetase
MGREKDLFSINDRFCDYYAFTKECFEQYNHTLTGMGINPYRKYNTNRPIPSERYLMLYHHLKSFKNYKNVPMHFHKYPEYGMFSSASQVQLDVTRENLIQTINVFSKIEPIKALLFSNSVLYGEDDKYTCFRDALWEYSTHGVNPHNIGVYDVDFKDINDLQAYLESLNIYCVMRDGAYINFPSMNLLEYFAQDYVSGEIYCDGEYRKIDVKPLISDIKYLRPFKFINLTFRGTVEFRSICTQPIRDSMCVAAFHLGLKDKLDELEEIVSKDNVLYHRGYTAGELRKLLIQDKLPEFINLDCLCDLSREIVDLACDGLEQRGIGEEIFLNPLYDRIKRRSNPGKDVIKSVNNGTEIEKIIEDYGKLGITI